MSIKNSPKYEIPLFKVPFPPELSIEELVSNRSEGRLKLKAPNGYLIYRLAFLKELRKQTDDNVSMTKISSRISSMWFNETIAVRDAYKELSKQVENRLTEIRQKELVFIDEPLSPSRITENNNVANTSRIPIFFDPSYQLCDPLYPPSLQQYPHPHFPSVNSSYNQILFSDFSYQPFTPVNDFFNINNTIDSCFCEACCNNFINYDQS